MQRMIFVIFASAFLLLCALAACAQAPQLVAEPVSAQAEISYATPTSKIRTASPTPAAPSATPTIVNLIPLPAVISGNVVDENGPIAGALVQLHGRPEQVVTDQHGSFQVSGISGTTPITVTAWSQGHYVGWTVLNPSAPDWKGPNGIKITLKIIPQTDNTQYPWFSFNGVKGTASCGLCHREYEEWQADAHSQSAKNIRFLTLYTGNNVQGDAGQATKWGTNGKALPPDPNLPYYGPGFQLDTPDRSGNCAACHTPVASKVANDVNCAWSGCHTDLTVERSAGRVKANTRPLVSSGDGAEGVTCDFCHKVSDVILDPATKLPLPDMPGILSMKLTRPEEGQQIFYGTLVDIPRRVSYLPLLERSEYCAPCHYGVFGGVVGVGKVTGGTLIYNSYGEWLESPYSDPTTGKTCQNCHMQVVDEKWFVFAQEGGLTRDYASLHEHYMPGASDQKLLQNSVSMKSTAQHSGNTLQVEVKITNDQTGHHVPTDAPTRSMILVVEAKDANGKRLVLKSGPVNPSWSGNYGGQPGKTFAKVLKDQWTGEMPTAAYWRPVEIIEDTRLAALTTDTTHYTFELPADQAAAIDVRLVFRRTFQQLAELKGFSDPDILMEQETIQVEK